VRRAALSFSECGALRAAGDGESGWSFAPLAAACGLLRGLSASRRADLDPPPADAPAGQGHACSRHPVGRRRGDPRPRAGPLLVELARKKFADTRRPRPPRGTKAATGDPSAEIKRGVCVRDLGRCAFIGTDGHRCIGHVLRHVV